MKLQEIVFLIPKSFSDTTCTSGGVSALLPASNSMEIEIPALISPAQPPRSNSFCPYRNVRQYWLYMDQGLIKRSKG